jgi:hypothetical protein
VEGVEVEILIGVVAVGPSGRVVVTTPNLESAEPVVLNGRTIPVLPLSTMGALLETTGRRERATIVRDAMRHDRTQQMGT